MRIGKNYGLRAAYDGHEGYYFPTIRNHETELFLFDEMPEDLPSHNASHYFNRNPYDWKSEFEDRCRWVLSNAVDLAIPNFCIKVQNKEEGLRVLELLAAHGYMWIDRESLTKWYPSSLDEIALFVQSTSNTNKLYVTYGTSTGAEYAMQKHRFTGSELLRSGNINQLFQMGVQPHKFLL